MNKSILILIIVAGLLCEGNYARGVEVPATLTVGSAEWDVTLLGRSGDMIRFRRAGRDDTPEFPVSSIKKAVFDVDINANELESWYSDRDYRKIILELESELRPYEPYGDLPSNLASYYAVLMELYYKAGEYNKCLVMASRLAKDDRDPALQRKSIVFKGLTMIETGRMEEAAALFKRQGWNERMPETSPPEDLFIAAKFMAMSKQYAKALETAAKIVAFHSQDSEWMRPAELLCAKMYLELGMLDSADEVIREITLLYKNTDEYEQAQQLKKQVDELRAKQGENDDSKDAEA